jgi:hypothetical protein
VGGIGTLREMGSSLRSDWRFAGCFFMTVGLLVFGVALYFCFRTDFRSEPARLVLSGAAAFTIVVIVARWCLDRWSG